MKRILIDYKKLDHKAASKLIDSYPDGYGDDDIITFKKPNGEIIEAVEVHTDDTVYLVKISKSLSNFIANFEEIIEKELEKDMVPEAAVDFDTASFEENDLETESMDSEY
ncbi:hypothetical protein [Flagellimonas zhangzhouensis]|uniref:DNA primase n=1 Tax=Flagellimonas zhangzhouensis TaxID=1073328 RepID=A0A1H2SP78_9FLAO|nr:hypothetical protein [Allomuricauda zhangzhouensis]SDQ77412.1 hypothetical protein SAMN05216294_2552 [Allomuricauda zhangzhouensis]SDW33398.1 hypothetical protein SAMN04487892_1193 [Allomuricauda zhangzhouensis]